MLRTPDTLLLIQVIIVKIDLMVGFRLWLWGLVMKLCWALALFIVIFVIVALI